MSTNKCLSVHKQADVEKKYKDGLLPFLGVLGIISTPEKNSNGNHQHSWKTLWYVLTFHLTLHIVFNVLKKVHQHEQKSPMLKWVLPKPPRVAFHNSNSLRNKLICSKLKLTGNAERGNVSCGRGNCKICNVLKPSFKTFKRV